MPVLLPTAQEGNPNWPLPADYDSLTEDGARLARVNAVSMWSAPFTQIAAHLFPGQTSLTPAQQNAVFDYRARLFVAGVLFFDDCYLKPSGSFDPLFYDDPPLPTPLGHRLILYQWGRYRRNIDVCARGFAKSTLCRKASIMRLITRPAYSIMYATSTHDNAVATGEIVRSQCYDNQRIHDDFAPLPEFGGRIRPVRGDSGTGVEYFHLNNGSWHRCLSAESRQRGGRARRYVLDDPEYDYHGSTSAEVRREFMHRLIFKVIRPMVARAGAGVDWIATFISRRHFAWHAMQTTVDPATKAVVAVNDAFEHWARLIIPAAYVNPETGEMESAWREMWPATRAERLALADSDPSYLEKDSLEELKAEMKSDFDSEYLCKPGSGEGQAFGSLSQHQHGYELSDIDDAYSTRPWDSLATITWRRGDAVQSMVFRDFLRRCRTFITLDTSYTSEATSDYKACVLMAHFGESNELFVLDAWARKCREPVLIDAAFKMADRWRCPLLAPEVVRETVTLYNGLRQIVATRAKDALSITHLPAVRKVNPGLVSKPDRIAGALTFRFDHGLIKLPFFLRYRAPWHLLFDQIEGFNPDHPDGGLENDDLLDCVAMSQLVVAGRAQRPLPGTSAAASPLDLLARRTLRDPDTDLPVALSLAPGEIASAYASLRDHSVETPDETNA